jgi:hypothetical protein
MTGEDTLTYLAKNYGEPELAGLGTGDPAATARRNLEIACQYGISGQPVAGGHYHVLCYRPKRGKNKVMYRVEDHTSRSDRIGKENLADPVIKVAPPTKSRYSRGLEVNVRETRSNKEQFMPTRGATKAKPAKAKVVEPEPEELEEELDEDEELEDELDEDEDEDESEEDEDESEDDEDDEDLDDEADEGDEEEEEEEEEDDEDEDESAVDYTPYATKPITDTMADFATWINQEIFVPVGSSIEEVGAEDPVRLIAIAGTARMEFQRSPFNISQREARKQAKLDAAAAKAKPVKETPAKGKPAAKTAPPAKGKPVAKAAPAKAAPAKAAPAKATAAKPAAKATAAKPAAKTGGRAVTRKKGAAAPY